MVTLRSPSVDPLRPSTVLGFAAVALGSSPMALLRFCAMLGLPAVLGLVGTSMRTGVGELRNDFQRDGAWSRDEFRFALVDFGWWGWWSFNHSRFFDSIGGGAYIDGISRIDTFLGSSLTFPQFLADSDDLVNLFAAQRL